MISIPESKLLALYRKAIAVPFGFLYIDLDNNVFRFNMNKLIRFCE